MNRRELFAFGLAGMATLPFNEKPKKKMRQCGMSGCKEGSGTIFSCTYTDDNGQAWFKRVPICVRCQMKHTMVADAMLYETNGPKMKIKESPCPGDEYIKLCQEKYEDFKVKCST